MIPNRRVAGLTAVLLLLVSAAVYLLTLTPTVPFWDSGEYIAVGYILGIPHPPGTPLYVLLARIATLIPIATVAERVNAMSAFAAALSVLFTYLSALMLVRRAQGGDRQPWQEWVAIAAAAIGALMLAFSDTFWDNSIEAEVYQLMSLAQILVFWLGLRWWESHDRKPTVGPLLLATYVMWLCVGLHLGVGIMGLPLIALVFLVDRSVASIFLLPFLSLLRVPAGFEKMVGGVILLAILTSVLMAFRRKLNGYVALAGAALAIPGLMAASNDTDFTRTSALLTAVAVLGPIVWLARHHREGRVLLLAVFLMGAGYSTHLLLPIRAAQHPAINEGAPADWPALKDLLERKQYGEMNPLQRKAPLAVQLDKEFWRYFSRQWPLFPERWDLSKPLMPSERAWAGMLPILLGLAGFLWQWRRDRRGAVFGGVFLGLSTAGMIVFLNFSAAEVRDRDYFFQSGFHAFTLGIALGAAWLVQWVRESFASPAARTQATVAATALLGLQPILLLAVHYHSHNRSGNYIARDYAHNMLAVLKPNSFMFTNGDNDTFPLWYIQEVEGFRKDVRIVNLSLLNTDWYIRQLRDQEPRVPIALDDRTVKALGAGAFMDEKGELTYTNDFMVRHILEQARTDSGWVRTPYFAVTVPQDFGYGRYFRQEGIVQEVMLDTLRTGVDAEATRRALYEVYRYNGLLTEDGSWDPKVYKDTNAENLSKNYAFAHMQLSQQYRRQNDYPRAIAEMQRVQRMFPEWVEIQLPLGGILMASGDSAGAWRFYEDLVKRAPRNPEAHYYRGAALAYQGRLDDALASFRSALALDPSYTDAMQDLFATMWDLGQQDAAVSELERFCARNPGDARMNAMLEQARAMMRGGSSNPLGVPPTPGVR